MNALFMANGIKDIVDSITQHFAKVQNMAAQLTDISENVSDVTVMAKILAGLSYKYGSFQTATIINDWLINTSNSSKSTRKAAERRGSTE